MIADYGSRIFAPSDLARLLVDTGNTADFTVSGDLTGKTAI